MSGTESAPRSKTAQQRGLRELMDQWAQDPAYLYLPLNLGLNALVSKETGEVLLKRFDAYLNRAVTKQRNWQDSPKRVIWFALPEKWEEHPHYHLVVRVTPGQVIPVQKAVIECWKKVIASGDVKLDVSPEGEDWIGYITKKWASLDDYVYSLQFKAHTVGVHTS
jgi:hypothetical protein